MRTGYRIGALTLQFAAALSTASALFAETAPLAYLGPPAIRIGVREAGVYRIARAAVNASSPDLAKIPPEELALYCHGRVVPRLVVPEGSALGEAGDVIFWGEPSGSRFAAVNAYWLAPGRPTGFVQVSGAPGQGQPPAVFAETARVEQDVIYIPPLPPDAEDHWFVGLARYDQPQEVTLDLAGLADQAPGFEAKVRVALQGQSNPPVHPNHRTLLRVNGQQVKEETWDGVERRLIEAAVDVELLEDRGNEVVVEAVRQENVPFDNVLLDWVEVVYPRTFEAAGGALVFPGGAAGETYRVSGLPPNRPLVVHLTEDGAVRDLQVEAQPPGGAVTFADSTGGAGGQFVVVSADGLHQPETLVADRPSSLRQAENRADYLVVAHASLLDAVQPLAERRRQQGLQTLVADVQDVYDEFSYGLTDPQAIRDLLAYASENYQPPAPRFLLLVGDASADYRGANPKSLPDLVPTHLGYTKDLGDTATDDWFADLVDDDAVPELAVGRIPARTPEEVEAAVAKTVAFEQAGAGTRRTALLVADNDEPLFRTMCEEASGQLTEAGWEVDRLYIESDGSNAGEVRAQLPPALARGPGLVVYVGHAFHRQWAHEGILKVEDLGDLTDAQPRFVISLSCLDGWFCDPNSARNLAESWLLLPRAGAAGYWSPTAMGYSVAHRALLLAFLEAALDPQVATVGEACRRAKAGLVQRVPTTIGRELAIMQTLFGDPAMRLGPWRGEG